MNRSISRNPAFLIAGISVLLFAGKLQATVRMVGQNGDSGAGSLRQAIADSAPGDTIIFGVPGSLTVTSNLVINKNLTITGLGARNLRIVATGSTNAVFQITSGNVSISDLTIGPAPYVGILLNGGTLTINNCAVSGADGGGLFTLPGTTLTMSNCTVWGNQISVQGGAGLQIEGTATLTNCTIYQNISRKNPDNFVPSGVGGGISNVGGTVTLVNCTVAGNYAASVGGGIHSVGGSFILTNTIVSGNTATNGPNGWGTFISNGWNLIAIDNGMTGFSNGVKFDIVGNGVTPRDPMLLPFQNNGGPTDTLALSSASSPAHNAGNVFIAPARDQRNFVRPDAPDIGACEFQASQPVSLANISSRATIQTGDDVLIGGFIITGNQLKKVALRAIGPSLAVPGKIADPVLELYQGSTLVTSNDDWGSAANKTEIINAGLAPADPHESAILMSLTPNAYTFIVRGANNGTGIGVVEAYDLDRTVGSKLGNISTRAAVQTGDNVLIGGFIVLGPDSDQVVVRAIGPSLSLPNKMLDPTLELHDGNGAIIAANDNWRSVQPLAIAATGLAPTNDAESALLATLPPGGYTAIVRGVNNTTGIAVVEVYGLR